MNITIQSVNFKASDHLESFVNEKVGKLFNLSDTIIRADVTLREGASGDLQNKYCEIRLVVPGNDHFVKKNTDGYEKSTLEAVDTLQNILKKKTRQDH
jgi:putative sigma-54 modulation protein